MSVNYKLIGVVVYASLPRAEIRQFAMSVTLRDRDRVEIGGRSPAG